MITFIVAVVILIVGYMTYGYFIEKVFGINKDGKTVAYTSQDGVDYVPLPTWKVFLIQFLNIAGLGPIFGAIMGVLYGPMAFIWIVFGTLFAGAVHDYLSGMISMRTNGASLPEIIGNELGNNIKNVMRVFSILLMILVGAVFVINPAELLASLVDGWSATIWIIIILVYYLFATLLPVDKIIGNLYPIFGIAMLFMGVGILFELFVNHSEFMPEITDNFYNHQSDPDKYPIFPMMFVSIACGAISGFHATQSPLMARCIKNEKYGRPIFYGAMVTEGLMALIWAAAAIAYTHSYDNLGTYLSEHKPLVLVNAISKDWLGTFGGLLALLGVIAAPITSGDTALRSARLIMADILKINQKSVVKRLMFTIPIFIAVYLLMQMNFEILWRYFAWCNQTLAVFSLWAFSVYLAKNMKPYLITLIPAMFMTMVSVTYIMFAPEGLNFDYVISIGVATLVTGILVFQFALFQKRLSQELTVKENI